MLIPGSDHGAQFEPAVRGPDTPAPGALVCVFHDRQLMVRPMADVPDGDSGSDTVAARLPTLAEARSYLDMPPVFLGRRAADRREVWVGVDDEPPFVPGLAACDLRAAVRRLPPEEFWVAARAIQIRDWHRDHRFCGRCGTATEDHARDRAKVCPSCGLHAYPRLAPAVIVLVERVRDDHHRSEILLGRGPHLPGAMYSTLAGFVEAGETLEHAVVREIEEEVGVRVGDLRYMGSQPWPFPHSLMIGFRARWQSGEIRLDPDEMEDAGWYTADALPEIPPPLSIARSLIDSWLAERRT